MHKFKMKNTLIIILLLIQIQLTGQIDYAGSYEQKNYGKAIVIKNDSTFEFSDIKHYQSNWATGKWRTIGDTIFFEFISIYDTLKIYDDNNRLINKNLILSFDQESKVIIQKLTLSQNDYTDKIDYSIAVQGEIDNMKNTSELSEFYQNSSNFPNKLFFTEKGLYEVDKEGNLIKKKKSSVTNKKFKSIYTKSK